MQFKDIKIDNYFIFNQNKYKKVSNRTALLIEFNRIFYFKNNDIINKIKG